jgi:ADP-ribose pyrophosphatase YjhB (NUDIX family)
VSRNPQREPAWLDWAKRLQAIAQTGLTFTGDPFDLDRYAAIRQIAAEMMAAGSAMPVEGVLQLFTRERGYATPKVDVRGIVFRGDAMLFVQDRLDGRWTPPGGWADVGQSAAECVVREIAEESGYETRAVKLLAVYDRNKHPHLPAYPYHIYKLFFRCELIGGAPATSSETTAVDFFREEALPELSLPRITPEQVTRMFAHRLHPEWPTEFD